MVGCGEEAQKKAVQNEVKDDPSLPAAIPCMACEKPVSKKTTECRQCGHPTPDSVVAYKKAQELVRIRAEEERKRQEELAGIRAEEVAAAKKRAEGEAKAIGKSIGSDDYKGIAEAIALVDMSSDYTGWVKWMGDNGQIKWLGKKKDGYRDGPETSWCSNGQKKEERTYKGGKIWTVVAWKPNGEKCPHTNLGDGDGVRVVYNEDGTERRRYTYKGGEEVRD